MTSAPKGQKGGPSGRDKADAARAERLRAALRENLKRRKAQAKGRSRRIAGAAHDSAGFVPDKTRIRPIILRLAAAGAGAWIASASSAASRSTARIPISGAKNATLPLMIASLLTDDTLILDNVPRLADVDAAAAHPRQPRRRHHGAGQAAGRAQRAFGQTLHISPRASSTPPRPTSSSRRCARASG